MIEIRLPQLGMGMTDGTILEWLKAEGDRVQKGETICEIEAAKTTAPLEAPENGVLKRILIKATENIAVNTVIAEFLEDTAASGPVALGGIAATPPPATVDAAPAATAPAADTAPHIQTAPSARKAARELGVDLSLVKGSGPGGRIVVEDVRAFSEQAKSLKSVEQPATSTTTAPKVPTVSSPPLPATQVPESASLVAKAAVRVTTGEFTEVPHSMTRRTIARRLTESKQQVPHFYVKASCQIDALLQVRKQINVGDLKVSVNDLVVRAVALALREVPDANVAWGEKAMCRYSYVDVAVAVATPRGLVTPIVRSVDRKPIREIAAEIKELAGRAREGKLKPEEYQGGNVSVSNLGMLGVEEFSAILNPPQSSIFAIGAGEERAVVRNGHLEVATMMTVTISVDHRAIDGAVAAQLLAAFKQLIETPTRILA